MSYRLNHIALCVKNPEEFAAFYQSLFEMLGLFVETRGIGENIMVLGLEETSIGLKRSEQSGSREGVDHFGFTTNDLADLESLAEKLNEKGISFERKKHRDNSQSIFLEDPECYKIQIVYMPSDMYIERK